MCILIMKKFNFAISNTCIRGSIIWELSILLLAHVHIKGASPEAFIEFYVPIVVHNDIQLRMKTVGVDLHTCIINVHI